MGKSRMKHQFEIYDSVGESIEEGMKFRVSRKRKIEEQKGVSIEGVKLKKGMKFELHDDFKIGKKHIGEDNEIQMEGGHKFKFHEDDIVELDSVQEGSTSTIKFHIERDRRHVRNKENEKITFTMDAKRFVELFTKHADIEIQYLDRFKFQEDDVIIVESVSAHPRKQEDERERKVINFSVERDAKTVLDGVGNKIVFEFNASIFVQRFEKVTDVVEKVAEVSERVRSLISGQKQEA